MSGVAANWHPPPGSDGGIDITAGRGPLGLDSPRLLAQVKSGSQIGSPIIVQLHGVMTTHGAEQGCSSPGAA
ncbi:restriction endonuclease [Micromonospora chalcea]|uniref:restriction endonuclease n=1 Tax=Micromonospora chalcea TaxID=1874 RepID=UPI003D71AFE3